MWWVARIPSTEQDVVVTYPTSSKYFFQPSPAHWTVFKTSSQKIPAHIIEQPCPRTQRHLTGVWRIKSSNYFYNCQLSSYEPWWLLWGAAARLSLLIVFKLLQLIRHSESRPCLELQLELSHFTRTAITVQSSLLITVVQIINKVATLSIFDHLVGSEQYWNDSLHTVEALITYLPNIQYTPNFRITKGNHQ